MYATTITNIADRQCIRYFVTDKHTAKCFVYNVVDVRFHSIQFNRQSHTNALYEEPRNRKVVS